MQPHVKQIKHASGFSSDVAPSFHKTLLGLSHRHIDPKKWDRVAELFEKKQYRDVIMGLLDYVDTEIKDENTDKDHSEFVVPHGSAIVTIIIDAQRFYVSAPFLTLSNTHNIPLLRQVAQINLYPLNLSNIVLEGNQLVFKYSCPLALCEPYKIYNVLREICAYADAYDDEFIKTFKAIRVHDPQIKKFSDKMTDQAWQRIQGYLTEAIDYVDYFEKKRLIERCVDICSVTLMKIDYYAAPQGVLRNDIEKTVSLLQDQDIPTADKLRKGKERLQQLKSIKSNELKNDLYIAETFIPLKFNFTNEMIDSYFQVFSEEAQKSIASRDFHSSVMTLQTAYLNLLYHYIFPEDIREMVTSAMESSANKTWEKASNILWDTIEDIINREKSGKKGFWSSLFGGKK